MSQEPHVLPLVMRMVAQIDDVFTGYVGPIAAELSRDEFIGWRAEGQVGPGGLQRYIARLARYIKKDTERKSFIRDALKRIQLDVGAKIPRGA